MLTKAVNAFGLAALALTTGCASLVNDSHIPVAMSFSDGSSGECTLTNKRGVWRTSVPEVPMIRRSDDALRYDCTAEHGGTSVGTIQSRMGAEIAMSAIFLDFGITDAITDKHRYYDASVVIPMRAGRDSMVGDQGRSAESSAADSRGTQASVAQ